MAIIFVLLAIAGAVVAFERFVTLHKGKIRSSDFLVGIVNLLKKGRTVEALGLCEETPGPVAAIVKVAILNIRKSSADFQLALQAAAAAEIPLLEKRVHSLLFISRLSQLVGVLAALIAFQGPFATLASGQMPVITTQAFGLAGLVALRYMTAAVALSVVFYACYHILNGRVRALVAEMERATIEIQSQMLANPVDAKASKQ